MTKKAAAKPAALWVHNHPGYSNCPRCVERIRALETELAEALQQRDSWNNIANMENAEKKKAEARVRELEGGEMKS